MSAKIVQIADQVATELNTATFSQPFTAARLFLPLFELKDLETLRVSVVPRSIGTSIHTRKQTQNDYGVDIGIQKRVDNSDAAVDPLLFLVEEIAEFFKFQRLAGATNAVWISTENDPVYAADHRETLRVFTSVLTLTFRVYS